MGGTQSNDAVIMDDDVVIDLRRDHRRSRAQRSRAVRPEDQWANPEVDRLLDAAWAVLARSGWDCLKVERVLVEAGLSTRSFYRHFANKNELLVVMLQHDIELLVCTLEQTVADLDSPVDQVVAWMVGMANVGTGCTGASHARFFLSRWWELSHEFPAALARCEDMMVEPLVKIIETGADRGLFTVSDSWEDARIIQVVAMDRLANAVSAAGSSTTPEQIEAMVSFVLRSLGVSGADRTVALLLSDG